MQGELFAERRLYFRRNRFVPGRRTLVFVHGLSGSSSAWAEYERRFEHDYNLVTFDLRGHGRSPKPTGDEDYALGRFVEDLDALIAHAGIDSCVLIGHSFGSLIALEYALKHEERVGALVLLSPTCSIKQPWLSAALTPLLKIAPLIDALWRAPAIGGHVDYRAYRGSGDWNLRRTLMDVWNTSLRTFLQCTQQACRFERTKALSRLTMPVLIMHGARDTIFPVAGAIEMAVWIRGAELVVLGKSDHILVLNHVERVSAAIARFLGDGLARGAGGVRDAVTRLAGSSSR